MKFTYKNVVIDSKNVTSDMLEDLELVKAMRKKALQLEAQKAKTEIKKEDKKEEKPFRTKGRK